VPNAESELDEQHVKAYELRADWSKWLVTVSAAVCAALWDVMKSQQAARLPYRGWVVAGWTCFALAAVAASYVLSSIHRDLEAGMPVASKSTRRWSTAQHALFAAGAGFLLVFVGARALSTD
jgi:hypothetical protein